MRVDYSIRVIRSTVNSAAVLSFRRKLFGRFLARQVFGLHTYTMNTTSTIGRVRRFLSLVTMNSLISQSRNSGICFRETDQRVGCGLISVLLATLTLTVGYLILFLGG